MTDTPIDLRPGYTDDAELRTALLALNNAHAVELSLADEARMAMLVDRAFLAARIGMLDAALIAFDQDADYDSANFQWFRARYPRFVYVDRVVTAPAARGRGLARKLYAYLFERPVPPDSPGWSAKSIPIRRTRPAKPFTARSASSRSAKHCSAMARPSHTSRTNFSGDYCTATRIA